MLIRLRTTLTSHAFAFSVVVLIVSAMASAIRVPTLEAQPDYDEWMYLASAFLIQLGHMPFVEVGNTQGPLFPALQTPLYSWLGGDLRAARVAMLPFSLLGVFAGCWGGWMLSGRGGALLCGLIIATEPVYLAVSRTFQSEGPAISFALAAVTVALHSRRSTSLLPPAGVGLLMGASLATKALAASAVAPCILLLLAPPGPWRMRLTRGALAIATAALAILLPTVFMDPVQVWEQSVWSHVLAKSRLEMPLSDNLRTLTETASPTTAALCGLALLSLATLARSATLEVASILIWLLGATISVLTYQPLFERHLAVLLGPLAYSTAFLAKPNLLQSRFAGLPGFGPGKLVSAAGVVWMLAASVPVMHQLQADDVRRGSDVGVLRQLVEPDEYVLSDNGLLPFLAQRKIVPELADTSTVRIGSGQLSLDQVVTAVEKRDVSVALVTDRRLMRVPGLADWLDDQFTLSAVDGASQIWVRKDRPELARRAMRWRAEPVDDVEIDERLELFAYRAEEPKRDGPVQAYFAWEATGIDDSDAALEMWLVDPQGRRAPLGAPSELISSEGDVSDWTEGSVHLTPVPITIPADLVAGTYRLEARLLDESSGAPLPARIDRREAPDGIIRLGRITVPGS
jgi:hypothetical protein